MEIEKDFSDLIGTSVICMCKNGSYELYKAIGTKDDNLICKWVKVCPCGFYNNYISDQPTDKEVFLKYPKIGSDIFDQIYDATVLLNDHIFSVQLCHKNFVYNLIENGTK